MALGEITKQLAKQALSSQVSEAIDSIGRGPETGKAPLEIGAVMVGQIQAMQRALKEDQELAVWMHAGPERLRVLEVYAPSWQVLVLTGVDAERNVTRVILHAHALQLLCKVLKVPAGGTASKVNVILPKGG